jgi:plastocyanin
MRGLGAAIVVAMTVLAGPLWADEVVVMIENFTFSPQTVTIRPGDTVIWKNGDDIPHSVVEKDLVFRSPPLDTGDAFSMTFTEFGEVEYYCGFHPMMQGKVIVSGANR